MDNNKLVGIICLVWIMSIGSAAVGYMAGKAAVQVTPVTIENKIKVDVPKIEIPPAPDVKVKVDVAAPAVTITPPDIKFPEKTYTTITNWPDRMADAISLYKTKLEEKSEVKEVEEKSEEKEVEPKKVDKFPMAR